MARIERTYNQEKAKQILKHNVALLDYSLRELPLDAVLPSRTDKVVCHKSVTHPFLFFAFSQIRNL